MNILVTGGLGFIGSHLVDKLIRERHKLFVIDNLSSGTKDNQNSAAHYYFFDLKNFIDDAAKLKEFLIKNKIQVIYHLAANSSVNFSMIHPVITLEENFNSSVALLEATKQTYVEKFIFASTSAVYGEPTYLPVDEEHPESPKSVYGVSKLIFEQYLSFFSKQNKITVAILRLPNVYGDRQRTDLEGGVVAIFNEKTKRDEEVIIYGDGSQERDWVHVNDIVLAFYFLLEKKINFETILIGSGTGNTVNYLFELFRTKNSYEKNAKMEESRDGDIKFMRVCNKNARSILNWEPTISLLNGVNLLK